MRYLLIILLVFPFWTVAQSSPYSIGVYGGAGLTIPKRQYGTGCEVGLNVTLPTAEKSSIKLGLFAQFEKDQFYVPEFDVQNSFVINTGIQVMLPLTLGNVYRLYLAPGIINGLVVQHDYHGKIIGTKDEYGFYITSEKVKGEKNYDYFSVVSGVVLGFHNEFMLTDHIAIQLKADVSAQAKFPAYRYRHYIDGKINIMTSFGMRYYF